MNDIHGRQKDPVLVALPVHAHLPQLMEICWLEGLAMHYGEIRSWAQVVHRSRRFFVDTAAQDIWAHFSPALSNVFTPQCLEVSAAKQWCLLDSSSTHRLPPELAGLFVKL